MIEEVQEQMVMSSVEMVLKNADLMKMINKFLPGPDFKKKCMSFAAMSMAYGCS